MVAYSYDRKKKVKRVFLSVQDITSPLNGKSTKGLVREPTLLKDLLGTLYAQENKTVQIG